MCEPLLLWIAFQMRSAATFRLANLVTAFMRGRLDQISTKRVLSRTISSANCSSLANTPKPVLRAAFREDALHPPQGQASVTPTKRHMKVEL